MFLFSLVEISESPQSFVPVPICGVTRVASLKGTFFSDTLIFGWRKHGFLWIFPSTDPTELRPLYGRYHQVCFVKTPFLDVSCEYLTYHILSHPITKKTLHDIHPGYGLQWPIKQKCEQCTPCRARGSPDALGEFFHPWPW